MKPNKYLLEISVETLEAAVAAERAGADRIELCADLSVGGVTPSAELMRATRALVKIPIFAMIRPRAGNFVYSDAELAQMRREIEIARSRGMDGIVLGVLREDSSVDVERTRELVNCARPLPVTFHRAFDEIRDICGALEDVIATGAMRILTSGGSRGAPEGAARLAELVSAARERIAVLPGGGINPSNLERVVRETGATEFHSGLGTSLPYPRKGHTEFEKQVGKLAAILGGLELERTLANR